MTKKLRPLISIVCDFLVFRRYRRRILHRAFNWRRDTPLPGINQVGQSDLDHLTLADFVREGGVVFPETHPPASIPRDILPTGAWRNEVMAAYKFTHDLKKAEEIAYAHLIQRSGPLPPMTFKKTVVEAGPPPGFVGSWMKDPPLHIDELTTERMPHTPPSVQAFMHAQEEEEEEEEEGETDEMPAVVLERHLKRGKP